ncbi:MAG: hypothetical protein HC900_07140 [Methylacidiphilales bacterium]|nr:hypothetical protein [Candidatus Methylacidiphilales bacterium]
MADIAVSAGVRQRLVSVQGTAEPKATMQDRRTDGSKASSTLATQADAVATGGLQNRANDLNALFDSMVVGIKTLEAAGNGLAAVTANVEAMRAILLQVRQDAQASPSQPLDDATAVETDGAQTDLIDRFNTLHAELGALVDGATVNGINLLQGDELRLVGNPSGKSNPDMRALDALALDIPALDAADLESSDTLDERLAKLTSSLDTLHACASNLESNLAIVRNRSNFTQSMINILQTGTEPLSLGDSSEEGANLLALQLRQQLTTTTLSLAAQADQAVLRLFG